MEMGNKNSQFGRPETVRPSTGQEIKELVTGAVDYVTELLNIEDTVDQIKAFIYAYPFVSCFIAIALTTCLIPVSIFLVFSVTTLLVSLLILFMIEGTIIACAGVFLLFVLGGCITFSFGLSVSIAFTYKMFTGLLRMLPTSEPGDKSTSNHLKEGGFRPKIFTKKDTETLKSGMHNED